MQILIVDLKKSKLIQDSWKCQRKINQLLLMLVLSKCLLKKEISMSSENTISMVKRSTNKIHLCKNFTAQKIKKKMPKKQKNQDQMTNRVMKMIILDLMALKLKNQATNSMMKTVISLGKIKMMKRAAQVEMMIVTRMKNQKKMEKEYGMLMLIFHLEKLQPKKELAKDQLLTKWIGTIFLPLI